MSLVRKKLARVELWDDIEANGGSRLRFFAGVVSARDSYELNGREDLTVVISRDQAYWDDLDHDGVIRTVDVDDNFDEWRIRKIADGKGSRGKEHVTLECDSIRFDLVNNSQLMERAEFDGSCNTHFEYYNLTPQQHAEVILEWAPDYFDIHPSFPDLDAVDMIYHDDTPLSALVELATIVGYELEVTRNGSTSYYVNLVAEIGSSTEKVEIRNGGNLLAGTRKQDSTDMGTRVYVRGGQQFGREGTLAGASFSVVQPSNPTSTFNINFTLSDEFGVIAENGQLNGLYVVGHDGSHSQVVSSIAPSTIRVASPVKLPPDGRMRFQRAYTDLTTGDTLYCDLTYMELPSAISVYGIKPSLLERSDIPAVNNILPNPFLVEWSDGGLPASFQRTRIGSPTIQQETHPLYTRHGGSSAHIRAYPGQGIRTAAFRVIPTEANPFLVVQAQLFVVSGFVRMEMRELSLDPETYKTVFPPEGILATTISQGTWIDSFGVNPGGTPEDNWYTQMRDFKNSPGNGADGKPLPGPAAKDYLTFEIALISGNDEMAEESPIVDFYLDALQVTQTPSFSEFFFGGRASNELWKLGNIALDGLSAPAQEYRVQIIDLWRLDPDSYTVNEIVLGGPIRLVDEEISLDFTTRIVKVTRNLLVEAETTIEVEDITNDLSRIMGAAERRIRRELMTKEGYDPSSGLLTGPSDGDDGEFGDDGSDGDDGSNPDDNLVGNDDYDQCIAAGEEYCSDDSVGAYTFHTYHENRIDLSEDGIVAGDQLAWGFQGKVTRTGSVVTGDPPPPGGETNPESTVKRVTSGLIFGQDNLGAGNIERWNISKWSQYVGSWSAADGKLVCTSAGGGVIRCTGFTPTDDMVVQVRWEADPCWQDADCNQQSARGDGVFPICRMEVSGGIVTYGYGVEHDFQCWPALPCGPQRTDWYQRTAKYNAGARTQLAGPNQWTGGLAQNLVKGYLKYKAFDGDQKLWIAGGAYSWGTTTDSSLAGRTGTVGFKFDETTDAAIVAVYVMSSNEITCTGLPSGYYFGLSWGDAQQESGGTATVDIGGLHLPFTTLRIWNGPPSSSDVVANFSPEGGIFGGDTYNYGPPDTGDPEDPENPDGPEVDDTLLAAAVDLEFYDDADLLILSTYHDGVTTEEYSRGTGSVIVPENATYILPVAKRVGEGEGIACVKELVVNLGATAGAFAPCELLLASQRNFRVPTDEGLVGHWSFDDYKFPLAWNATGTVCGGCKSDVDGLIRLSRTEYDSSPKRNHLYMASHYNHWISGGVSMTKQYRKFYENIWQPEIGVSGWGRVYPEYFNVFSSSYIPSAYYYDGAYFGDTQRGDFGGVGNITMVIWVKPFRVSWAMQPLFTMYGHANQSWTSWNGCPVSKNSVLAGYRLYLDYGWDYTGHLVFRYFSDDTGPSGPPEGDDTWISWTADPCFGEVDSGTPYTRDNGDLCSAYAFYAIRISGAGGRNATQDITAFYGNSITGFFRRLSDSDIEPAYTSAKTGYSSRGVPGILDFEEQAALVGHDDDMSHFTVGGWPAYTADTDYCSYDQDPGGAVIDEPRYYQRALSDEEIYGLYLLGCGSNTNTVQCAQVNAGLDGSSGNSNVTQDECGGTDPSQRIIMSSIYT